MKRRNVPPDAAFRYMSMMAERFLTPAETRLVGSLFGDAIEPGRIRVCRRRWFPFHPRDAIMAPDGHIWCHPRGSLWRDCYASASLTMQALFVHELVHVWQAQTRGRWYLPLMRHPFCRYAYALTPGRPFARYGIEQQAEIVADAFLLMRGVVKIGGPALADYRRVIPFPMKLAPATAS